MTTLFHTNDPISDMCFGKIAEIYDSMMNETYGNENEAAHASLEFGTFSSWDETLGQFFGMTNEQLEEQLKENKLCVVAGAKLPGTVSAETVLIVDGDVIDVRAKNVIAINSHLGSAYMHVDNLFMYGGELSASHLIANGTVILGSCRIIENGKAEIIRNVLPPMNPETQKSLQSFLQFIAGTRSSSNLDLEFDEVKVPNQLTAFASPMVRTVVAPDFLDKTPYSFTSEELADAFEMFGKFGGPKAFSVKQNTVLRDIAQAFVSETSPLLKSRFLPDESRKEITEGLAMMQQAINVLNQYIGQQSPSANATTTQTVLNDIQQYINRGMAVDPNCPLPTNGKKVGSAKWVSCVLSTYFNPAMNNVQDKGVLMQLATDVESFRVALVNHIAAEAPFLK